MYYIFNIQYYSSASCAMHPRTGCPMQHYTEMRYWSDMRYNNVNWSAISGNPLWGSGTNMIQGTQAQPYKLGTLQESALPCISSLLLQAWSGISATFLSSVAIQTSYRSSMNPANISLSCPQPSHLSRKFSSSTSSTVHCLQDLSSLFRPFHLPCSLNPN